MRQHRGEATRKAKALAVLALVAAVGGVWLYSGGCDRPKPNEPEGPKDYIVYLIDGGVPYTYYGYHTVTEKLDSMTLPVWYTSEMRVTSDGKTLYIPDTGSIAVIDITSKSKTAALPYKHTRYLALSADDRYLAVMRDSLVILNTSDYSVVFSDTGEIQNGVFSADSKAFYGVDLGDLSVDYYHHVYRLDLTGNSFTVTRQEFLGSIVTLVVPSLNENLWFMFMQGQLSGFTVYDVAADSIIFREHLPANAGEIVVAPDGQKVLYSYPGAWFWGPHPSSFRVYDVSANHRLAEVEVFQIRESGDTITFPVWRMVITPDSRLMACNDLAGGNGILIIDINTLEITHHLPNIDAWDLAVQSLE